MWWTLFDYYEVTLHLKHSEVDNKIKRVQFSSICTYTITHKVEENINNYVKCCARTNTIYSKCSTDFFPSSPLST